MQTVPAMQCTDTTRTTAPIVNTLYALFLN